MDIRVFDKFAGVAPLLVELYDSHKLYKMAPDHNTQIRYELIDIVTDLFSAELSSSEKEIISDILIRLTREAEKDLRHALAKRLAEIEDVPLRLVLHIANDDIDVAEIVLKKSPVLGSIDLVYILKSHSEEYWRAIAKRKSLGEKVVKLLSETKDIVISFALAQSGHTIH